MNKSLIILAGVVVLMFGGMMMASQKSFVQESQNVLQQLTQSAAPVLKYNFQMTVLSEEQAAASQYNQQFFVQVIATVKMMPVYRRETKTYDVFIDYDYLNLQKVSTKNNQDNENYNYDQMRDDGAADICYKAVIDAYTGKLLSLQKTSTFDMDIIDQVTKDQIKQVFPDIRASKQSGMLLTASLESVDFGKANVRYESRDDLGFEILSKSYSDEDLVKNKYDMGGENAELEYKLTSFLRKDGIVQKSVEVYYVDMENLINLNLEQANEDMQNNNQEMIGEVSVSVRSTMDLEDVEYNAPYFEQVNNFIAVTEFTDINIKNNNGEVYINDLSAEPAEIVSPPSDDMDQSLLFQSSPMYSKDYDIFSKKFLGQTVAVVAQYKNFGQDSNVQGHIMFNGRSLKKLVDINFKHCGGTKQKDEHRTFNMLVFKAVFPILGIITIPVQVDLTIGYGYEFFYGGSDQAHGCEVKFQPYFRPGIEASGGISIAIAKGGIYARGTVANTYLTFAANVVGFPPKLSGAVHLSVSIKPFQFDIGAFYQHIKCDLKKLFRFPPKFSKVCSMSDKKYIVILDGSMAKTYTANIWNWNWKI